MLRHFNGKITWGNISRAYDFEVLILLLLVGSRLLPPDPSGGLSRVPDRSCVQHGESVVCLFSNVNLWGTRACPVWNLETTSLEWADSRGAN